MPKPVLSDSLFNADDVATAVAQEANLQVANENLGVVDRSSLFTKNSSWIDNSHSIRAYSFNGFMFVNINIYSGSTPGSGTEMYQINDSNYYPTIFFTAPTVSYEGDLAFAVYIQTNGQIQIAHPLNPGQSAFHVVSNFFYRYS